MSGNLVLLNKHKVNFSRLEMYTLSHLQTLVDLKRDQGEEIDYRTLLLCFTREERDQIALELTSMDGDSGGAA